MWYFIVLWDPDQEGQLIPNLLLKYGFCLKICTRVEKCNSKICRHENIDVCRWLFPVIVPLIPQECPPLSRNHLPLPRQSIYHHISPYRLPLEKHEAYISITIIIPEAILGKRGWGGGESEVLCTLFFFLYFCHHISHWKPSFTQPFPTEDFIAASLLLLVHHCCLKFFFLFSRVDSRICFHSLWIFLIPCIQTIYYL